MEQRRRERNGEQPQLTMEFRYQCVLICSRECCQSETGLPWWGRWERIDLVLVELDRIAMALEIAFNVRLAEKVRECRECLAWTFGLGAGESPE
jgi:hypothetical protein